MVSRYTYLGATSTCRQTNFIVDVWWKLWQYVYVPWPLMSSMCIVNDSYSTALTVILWKPLSQDQNWNTEIFAVNEQDFYEVFRWIFHPIRILQLARKIAHWLLPSWKHPSCKLQGLAVFVCRMLNSSRAYAVIQAMVVPTCLIPKYCRRATREHTVIKNHIDVTFFRKQVFCKTEGSTSF